MTNLLNSQDFKYSPVTAVNGEEALIEAKASFKVENLIKIIFMGYQMLVIDEFEATIKLVEMMKQEIPTASIIAITANDTEEDRQRCFRSGMSDHFEVSTGRKFGKMYLKQDRK